MPTRFTPSRRDFAKAGTAAAVSLFHIVPPHCLGLQGQTPPSDTINFGHIGIGGRGKGFLRTEANFGKEIPAPANLGGDGSRKLRPVRSLALCDVDNNRLDAAASLVGGRPRLFKDFRKLLEDKDVDAVVIASPDHWHALQTILACQAGKDVYCEKPASNTIEEGRAMVTAADRYARVVQIGSQGRSQMAAFHAKQYIRNGQLGKISQILAWHYASPDGDWTPATPVPPELDYDMWLGPARYMPYNQKRTHQAFRWLIDFGGGQIRDRGAHVMSIANWIMECDDKGPVSIEASGEPPKDGMFDAAVSMYVKYEFKDPDWTLVWAQPGEPSKEIEARYGAVYHGEQGRLTVVHGDGQATKTEPKAIDYKPSIDGVRVFKSPGHMENFEDCIRTREKPIMHMEAGHRVSSLCILGNVAFQLRRKLEWDWKNERVLNDDEANRMLSRPGRGPWNL
jgi:predicted dehydrogenase